jgi:hypothetical protein
MFRFGELLDDYPFEDAPEDDGTFIHFEFRLYGTDENGAKRALGRKYLVPAGTSEIHEDENVFAAWVPKTTTSHPGQKRSDRLFLFPFGDIAWIERKNLKRKTFSGFT